MRLLNTNTLQLESFPSDIGRPLYAILSHTWEEDEVLFEDVQNSPSGILATTKVGRSKIIKSCAKASASDIQYIWIDTCCIDKSSSAELSEAINSMFQYYRSAKICYAYLADVLATPEQPDGGRQLESSRWFRRGWTLQELIAPWVVQFCDREWKDIGTRELLAQRISSLTNIDYGILTHRGYSSLRTDLFLTSVSTRLSWSVGRETTRIEDQAYCLLGIFDVNMPLLYGEGRKAFRRLQEEIIKKTNDQSILAWAIPPYPRQVKYNNSGDYLAPSPISGYRPGLSSHPRSHTLTTMAMSSKGLEIEVLLGYAEVKWGQERPPLMRHHDSKWYTWLAVLDCSMEDRFLMRPAIILEEISRPHRLYQKSFDVLIWLENRRTAWWDDGARRFKISIDMDKAAYTPITIEGYDTRLRDVQVPPLYLSIKSDRESPTYNLLMAIPPVHGDRRQTGSSSRVLTFQATLTESSREAAGTLGVMYFRHQEKGKPGFFIFWGVDVFPRYNMKAALLSGRSWWDKSSPRCSIVAWAELFEDASPETAVLWADPDAFDQAMTTFRASQKLGFLRGRISRKQEMKIGNCLVRANISTVDFLDRRAFQLDVEME